MIFIYIRPVQFNYLSYELRRQEMSHFEIKKKLKNVFVFFIFIFISVCRLAVGSEMFLSTQRDDLNTSLRINGSTYTWQLTKFPLKLLLPGSQRGHAPADNIVMGGSIS